jgi:glycosyltransferase involved in cell wall biosynthesis
MYKGQSVAAVVPAYNEEKLIGKVIQTMPEFVDRIFIVDDNSSDSTSAVAEGLHDPRVRILRHERNTGVGGAVLDGHRAVVEEGVDIAVVMAGDAQMDPAYLPALLDPIVDEGYGFTKANRFFSMESFSGMPRHRIWGNVILGFATKLASGYWHLFDPQNGYTAIRRTVLERLPLGQIALGYPFENDLLIHLNILNVRAKDVPVPAVYGDEVSRLRVRSTAPQIASVLFRGFWKRMWWKYVLWTFSPIAMLFFSGLLLTLFGFFFGLGVFVLAVSGTTPTAATVMISVGPLLVGVNFLVQALVLDIQESPR